MKKTKIQWCHSTVNPVMGCDGCELWPPAGRVESSINEGLKAIGAAAVFRADLKEGLGKRPLSKIYRYRARIARKLAAGRGKREVAAVIDAVRRKAKCYAGLLGTFRAGNEGYAKKFEEPKRFPKRMAIAARMKGPTAQESALKPWLSDCPRLIFVSDMGDALSRNISFDFLRSKITDNASSVAGRRHIWLWLSKRPSRMAAFGKWLKKQGGTWPENLMAMTTVTAQSTANRVKALRRVPSLLKGISLEPLFEPVELDLTGIDWVIVGGGSDVLAEPFHVEWALALRNQCKKAGVAFFLKQLGRRPFYRGQDLQLKDKHGGDWGQWYKNWRVREVPQSFRDYRP